MRKFPSFRGRAEVVYNGVDTGIFLSRTVDRNSRIDSGKIVYVGRVSPEKGVHVLLAAFVELARDLPEARLSIIGGTNPAKFEYIVGISEDPRVSELQKFYTKDKSYLDQLKEMIPSSVADRVEFMGNLSQAELHDESADAAIAVFPSVWNEPFGMVIVEAMASGVPVVATKSGGIPEFVAHNQDGVLVERGDVGELKTALTDLLTNQDRRRRLAREGEAKARQAYSWEETAESLSSALKSLSAWG